MRILYFLSAVVLAVVLVIACTSDPKGVVEPLEKTGLVPPPAGGNCSEVTGTCDGVSPCTPENAAAGLFYFPSCLGCDKYVQCSQFGQLFIASCPSGTVWNQTTLSCTSPNDPGACTAGDLDCPTTGDPCEANPCVNGDCSDNGDGTYTCFCLPGWTGTNCDVPEVTDSDGDGVPDPDDECPDTESGAVVDATGCSIDQYCPCDNDWKNHGKYVSCVAHSANDFLNAGLITQAEKDAIVSAAAQSDCGKK